MAKKTKAAKAKEPSYYLRSVAALKRGADKIARATESRHKLPAGSVHVSITKLPKLVRSRLSTAQ